MSAVVALNKFFTWSRKRGGWLQVPNLVNSGTKHPTNGSSFLGNFEVKDPWDWWKRFLWYKYLLFCQFFFYWNEILTKHTTRKRKGPDSVAVVELTRGKIYMSTNIRDEWKKFFSKRAGKFRRATSQSCSLHSWGRKGERYFSTKLNLTFTEYLFLDGEFCHINAI